MDTLALLCTLHADGPASLQRLRAAELYSIDDVLGCSVEKTADVLVLSMAQARRFHREARMLAMRMHTEGLDREERMYPGSMGLEAIAPRAVSEKATAAQATPPSATQTIPAPPTPTAAEPMTEAAMLADQDSGESGPEDMRKKPDIASILAPVLERWEEQDAATTPEAPQAVTTPSTAAPREAAQADAAELDGVDDSLRDALRAAGYATLTSLAEVEPLELSRAMGRPYSEACRVRFLAQRALEGDAPPRESAPSKAEAMSTQTKGHESAVESTDTSEPCEAEPGEGPTTPDAQAQSEAERVLAELSGNVEPATERFSPSPPEYPEETLAEESPAEEGPGGPFA